MCYYRANKQPYTMDIMMFFDHQPNHPELQVSSNPSIVALVLDHGVSQTSLARLEQSVSELPSELKNIFPSFPEQLLSLLRENPEPMTAYLSMETSLQLTEHAIDDNLGLILGANQQPTIARIKDAIKAIYDSAMTHVVDTNPEVFSNAAKVVL